MVNRDADVFKTLFLLLTEMIDDSWACSVCENLWLIQVRRRRGAKP